MKKKYQVFISSTYEDLKVERQKVVATILKSYHIPIGMEMFSADDAEQWKVIQNTIQQSDYYVLILKHRYGSLTKDGISFTEKEYDYARKIGIPILSFIISKAAPITADFFETDPAKKEKLDNFKKKVFNESGKMCDYWRNEDELCTQLNIALQKQYDMNERSGWIRQIDALGLLSTDSSYNIGTLKAFQERLDESFAKAYGNIYGSKDFLDFHQEKLFHQIEKQTYIDLFERQVIITPSKSREYWGKITITTQIDFINVQVGIPYYRANPRFMTKEQAQSYKHIEFSINDIDYTKDIRTEITVPNEQRQFPYLVRNEYPLTYDKPNMRIVHQTEYEIDLRDFFQSYQIIFPCKTFLATLLIKDNPDKRFSIVSTTYSSYNVHVTSDYSREYRTGDIDTVRIGRWALPGSGYTFRLIENR